MSTELQQILAKAARTGEVIRIIYHGGSQPGSQREISPITVTSTETRARDISTGIVKEFILSKIELVDADSHAPNYDPTLPPQVEEFKTIEEALSGRVSELEHLGWHVDLSSDSISLFNVFKNGKLKKIPDITLSYNEYVDESYYDPNVDKMVEEKKKSTKPFRLSAKNLPIARTFGHLSKAIELFFDEAKSQSPSNAP